MPLLTALLAAAFLAQAATPPRRTLQAQRAAAAPTIDGRLDEPAWLGASVGGEFTQFEPTEGAPATERTEIRILYDNAALYVGVRLYDNEPSRIVRRLSRRDDDANADRFTFYVDALHDRLTGAAFEVSAAGAQRDAIISNDTNRDSSWDAVWDSAVTIDGEGWTAELRIPLSQLRYLAGPAQTWGFNVERVVHRKNERDWFELVPKRETGLASRMADLTGIDGIEPRRAAEMVVYGAARSEHVASPGAGNPFNDGSRTFGGVGFDVKYALRPNIVLNATVNPDFGQVEIDPAVVNLGAFETFYPEKRPFFIEGAPIFSDFGTLGANNRFGFNRSQPLLLHTRRIGRTPQGHASGDFVDRPAGTTILGAAKLTGKTTGGWSFGVLDAVAARESANVSSAGAIARESVEPRTNYFAGRVLKEFGAGRSGLGALVTTVNREAVSSSIDTLLPGRAHVAGVDGYVFLDRDRKWVLNGQLTHGGVSGSPDAITRLQLEPQRYFQRPLTPQVSFDPSRTTLGGWNGDVNLNRNEGSWTVNAALWGVSPGFESGDLGFHFNGDAWGSHVAATWKQITPDRLSRDRHATVATFGVWDFGGAKLGQGVMSFWGLTLPNYWNIGGNIAFFAPAQDGRLTRGGPPVATLRNGFVGAHMSTDSRKDVVVSVSGGRDWSEESRGGANGTISIEWKPSPKLSVATGPSVARGMDPAQYVMTVDDAVATATGGKRYVFSRLQRTTVSIDTRINVLFSPTMSLQTFMQPLVVVGDYGRLQSLAQPNTFDFEPFEGGPDDLDFNFTSLRVNAIFRWEWRLGSTLYVAWTEQRQDVEGRNRFAFGPDFRRVFTGPADNTFMVKISRWFGR